MQEKHHSQSAKHYAENKSHRTRKKDAKMQKIIIGLALVFLAIVAYGTYIVYSSNAIVSQKIAASVEAAKPANIQITKILAQSCADCFDISVVDRALAQLNVKTSEKTLDYAGAEAKQLISKYSIKKIPTVLITGEVAKAGISFWSQIGTQESDGTLVLRYGAPFIDPASGAEFGKVQLVELSDKTCGSCYNVSLHQDIVKSMGITLSGTSGYDISSAAGKNLIAKYNITKVPTILLSPDLSYYDENLKKFMLQFGTIESGGWYVFRNMQGLRGITYFDVSLNRTVNTTAQ